MVVHLQYNNYSRIASTLWGQHPYPGEEDEFTIFKELDTGRTFRINDSIVNTLSFLFQDKILDAGYDEHHDSSMATIFGFEFAKSRPSFLYLLERSLRNEVERSARFANNNVTFKESVTSPLTKYHVAQFNGNTSELFFSNVPELVGDTSFLLGGWFLPRSLAKDEALISYGTRESQRISLSFKTNNRLELKLSDGINELIIEIPSIAIKDLRWHYIAVFVDRLNSTVTLIVTNQQYETHTFKTVPLGTLGSLDIPAAELIIGARNVANGNSNYFLGEASNIHLYQWAGKPDYNIIPLLISGLREPAKQGEGTITQHNDIDKRLNGFFQIDAEPQDYHYAVINLDAGKYEVVFSDHAGPDSSGYEIYIDNIYRGFVSTYAQAPINNLQAKIDDLDLSKGFHFIKIRVGPRDAQATDDKLRFSQIKFIKREGDNEGGASDAVLLGDEFRDITSSLSMSSSVGSPWGSELSHATTAIVEDGEYAEGEIYLKGGLYNIVSYFRQRPDGAIVDILINGRKIMSVDTYAGTSVRAVDVQAAIQQGRNLITLKINGKNAASTGYKFTFNALSFAIKEGNSYQDRTAVREYHDVEVAAGNVYGLFSSVYDHGQAITGVGANHKWVSRKWFVGGSYKVRLNYSRQQQGGDTKLTVGDETIFSYDSGHVGSAYNQTLEKIIQIDAGYHEIAVTNIGGTNNNYSSFTHAVDCILLARGPYIRNSNLANIKNDGSIKKIGETLLSKDAASATVKLGDVSSKRYEELIIHITGTSTDPMDLYARINGIDGNIYAASGILKRYGIPAEDYADLTSWLHLINSVNLAGTPPKVFDADFTIKLRERGDQRYPRGTMSSGTELPASKQGHWTLRQTLDEITSLSFIAGSALMRAGTIITIYGRQKN